MVLALTLLGGTIALLGRPYEDRLPPGVRVGGVALGGQDAAAAAQMLGSAARPVVAKGMVLTSGSERFTVSLRKLKTAPDTADALRRARDVGFIDRVRMLLGLASQRELDLRFRVDEAALTRALRPVRKAVEVPPVQAGVRVSSRSGLRMVRGKGGILVDRVAVLAALRQLHRRPPGAAPAPRAAGGGGRRVRRAGAGRGQDPARDAARGHAARPRLADTATALTKALEFAPEGGEVRLKLTRPAIRAELHRLFGAAERQPHNARFAVGSDGGIRIIESSSGKEVDADTVRQALQQEHRNAPDPGADRRHQAGLRHGRRAAPAGDRPRRLVHDAVLLLLLQLDVLLAGAVRRRERATRSVTRRRCASAVAKAGLMSAIRTGICRLRVLLQRLAHGVRVDLLARRRLDVRMPPSEPTANRALCGWRSAAPNSRCSSARMAGRVSFSRTSPPSERLQRLRERLFADRVAVPEQHDLVRRREQGLGRGQRPLGGRVVRRRLHAAQGQLQAAVERGSCRSAASTATRSTRMPPLPRTCAACPLDEPARRPGRAAPRPPCGPAERARQRRLVDPEPQVELALRGQPEPHADAVDESHVAGTAQRVGGVGRRLELASDTVKRSEPEIGTHALRPRAAGRGRPLCAAAACVLAPRATPPTRTPGGRPVLVRAPQQHNRTRRAQGQGRAPRRRSRQARNCAAAISRTDRRRRI